jgi:membrane protein DedA with SNARE-associated domain
VLGNVSSLVDSPWILAFVTLSVLLDVFLPVLPSGVLLISAATASTTGPNGTRGVVEIIELLLCATAASCLGDLAAYCLAWRGSDWLDRRMSRSRRISAAQRRLGQAVANGGGTLVLIARFAPAGRSVVSLSAGTAHRRLIEFLPWSALAGLLWAAYSVGLGYADGRWFGATWLATVSSLIAVFGAGFLAASAVNRERRDTAS